MRVQRKSRWHYCANHFRQLLLTYGRNSRLHFAVVAYVSKYQRSSSQSFFAGVEKASRATTCVLFNIKTDDQLDLQALYRVRDRLVH